MTPLAEIGRWLRESGYAFTTVTPETHRRVTAHASRAENVRDIFGWSLPFEPALVPPRILDLLRAADAIVARGELVASTVRYSSLGEQLFVHSAYPTIDERAVFFGPDTYRFCAFLSRCAFDASAVVDVGCGSGAGGISLADRVDRIILADINPRALSYARINATLAGIEDRVTLVESDLYANIAGSFDLVVANPPYLVDPAHRAYRDGGGDLGTELGVRMVREALPRLAPGGRVLLYTGSPIVDGVDRVERALRALSPHVTYEEIDPDVFGEELETPAYAGVDRIAAVGACVLHP
jgi:release factor glutamine methyltransferase